jgi:hypothetical protein
MSARPPKIDAEMERRLAMVFEPKRCNAYATVLALPKVEDIKTNGERILLVLSPDKRVPPEEAERLFNAVAEKNNFCVVTGDGTDLAKLEDKVRRIWATAKVMQEDGGDRSPNLAELEEEAETAEFEFNSALINLFNRVYYPARLAGRTGIISLTQGGFCMELLPKNMPQEFRRSASTSAMSLIDSPSCAVGIREMPRQGATRLAKARSTTKLLIRFSTTAHGRGRTFRRRLLTSLPARKFPDRRPFPAVALKGSVSGRISSLLIRHMQTQ